MGEPRETLARNNPSVLQKNIENTGHVIVKSVKSLDDNAGKKIVSAIPKKKQQLLKWNGWGYKDSGFQLINRETIVFTGNRYPIGGSVKLPLFKNWVEEKFKVDLSDKRPTLGVPNKFPESVVIPEFMTEIKVLNIDSSDFGEDRLVRCHGQSLHDIHTLREGEFKRIPDLVLWPVCHEEVVQIVQLANKYDVVLIPYGGGTSVSGAVTCPENEPRSIAVLDTSQMNRMLWLDRENLTACFEAGIVGQDLERELQKIGLTVGHEPDSYEFSTLGGWVATRASGMKKNVYGNIEDILVRVKMVTVQGVLEKNVLAPRISCGPDFNQIIMGSEGMLGVITEVVIKVRPLPPIRKYGSLAFPNLESGIKCLREIAKRRCQPASIRLMDTEQFEFGSVLKPVGAWYAGIAEVLKKTYLTKIKGFDLQKIAAATLLFEGEEEDIKRQEKLIIEIAKKYGGFSAGATNGMKGYILTFVIAYIRDLALEYSIVAESFETSMPWDRCEAVCRNVKIRVGKECKKHNVNYYMISCRVTQTYDAGACVYFYFGFNHSGLPNPVETYEAIENCARDEVLASGGSISHHHGIGKIRSKWYRETVSDVGVDLYKATKKQLDPNNIFAVGNLICNKTDCFVPPKSKL